MDRENIGMLLAVAAAHGTSAANHALRTAPGVVADLDARAYSVLEQAILRDGPSQRELAELLRLDPSQIVALVDGLQAKGLVERRRDPADRRRYAVVATTAGQHTYAVGRVRIEGSLDDLLADLDPAERATLHDLLHRIVRPVEARAVEVPSAEARTV